MAAPRSKAFWGFQLEATAAAVGKDVAGSLSETPLSPEPFCLRRPWGPSDMHRLGTPSRRMGLVYMKSVPDTRAAFSSTVISFRMRSISMSSPLVLCLRYYFTGSARCCIALW